MICDIDLILMVRARSMQIFKLDNFSNSGYQFWASRRRHWPDISMPGLVLLNAREPPKQNTQFQNDDNLCTQQLPLVLKSSTSMISCRQLGGVLLTILCTVRISVENASLWKITTILAVGRSVGYTSFLHLEDNRQSFNENYCWNTHIVSAEVEIYSLNDDNIINY